MLRKFHIIKTADVYFVWVSFVEGTDSDHIRCVCLLEPDRTSLVVERYSLFYQNVVFMNCILVQGFQVKVVKVLFFNIMCD